MLAIKCKAGSVFSACVKDYVDEEWKAQELYYQKQGCTVEEVESVQLQKCECAHCKTLKHEHE
jgi:hypothetical protein